MIRQHTYPSDPSTELHSSLHHNGGHSRRHSELEPDWDPSKDGVSIADHASEGIEPPSKRRRVALACTVCRGRKSRCDGARPKCSLCIELGFECVYQQSSSYSNIIVGKEYLSTIEDRLKLVEGRLSSLEGRDQNTAHSTGVVAAAIPPLASSVNPKSRDTTPPETACVRDDSIGDAETIEDPIDGMGAVTFAEEETHAYFGPSSNIDFIRDVSQAVARLTNNSRPWRPSPAHRNSVSYSGGFVNASRPPTPSPIHQDNTQERVNIYALPAKSVARQLLAWYFSNTAVMFPYFHEQSFMAEFDQISKTKFKGVRRTWLALFNMILAHAAVHARDISTTPGGVEPETYFKRAFGLYNEKPADGAGTSVEVVILLLLMGQYLQGTQKSMQTWKMHGLAVRAAFQIGLHSSDLARFFDPIVQEVRKRTWFGCIMFDRTLSMTFGRPASIPNSYDQLELPVEFSTLNDGVAGSDVKESLSIAFYNGTATLYKVLCTTIDTLYGQNLACSFPANNAVDTVALVYKIENQLSDWVRGLPSHMTLVTTQEITPERLPLAESSAENDWRRLRLRFVLTLRYTNVRILLHRPVLVKFLNGLDSPVDSQDVPFLQQVGAVHVQIAIKSAKEIICLVLNALRSASGKSKWGLLGAWWFSLYYTFNAALVLGACVLVQVDQKASGKDPMTLQDSTEDMTHHLNMAVDALRYLDNDNRMIARCRDYLEQFVQVVHALAVAQNLVPHPPNWQGPYRQAQPPSHPVSHSQSQPQYAPQILQAGSEYAMLQNGANAGGMFTGMVSSTKQSPLGMELGEFMLESDLEFLNNQSYAFGRSMGP